MESMIDQELMAAALRERRQSWDPEELRDIVSDLVPVVHDLIAAELEAAAEAPVVQSEMTRDAYAWDTGRDDARAMLRARAAALRAGTAESPRPGTGTGGSPTDVLSQHQQNR